MIKVSTKRNTSIWPKVDKIKKYILCKKCKKRIEVEQYNQRICKRCGYRERRK